MRAAIIGCCVALLCGCLIDVDYGGTTFLCADEECPDGLACIGGECVPQGTVSDAGSTPDGPVADATPLLMVPPFGAPAIIPNLSVVGEDDDDPSMRADRLELFFASTRVPANTDDIYVATRSQEIDAFSTPTPVVELNSPEGETTIAITSDGLNILFASSRVGGAGDQDLYLASRPDVATPFSTPAPITELNTAGGEFVSWISDDLLTLLFHTNAVSGNQDIYMAERASVADPFGSPTPLTSINGPDNEVSARLLRAGLLITFSSNRPGGLGGFDAYYATRASTDEPFGAPVPIDGINSDVNDNDIWMAEDLCYVVMNRPDGDGTGGDSLLEARCSTGPVP